MRPKPDDEADQTVVIEVEKPPDPARKGQNGQPPAVTEVDLDHFLQLGGEEEENLQNTGRTVPLPQADRIAVVGIVVDDSGSMSRLVQAVIDGLKLTIVAFRGARGSDFYLDIRGFIMTYFKGLIKGISADAFNNYRPVWETTPLISHSIAQMEDLRRVAEEYRAMGIPTTVAMLIITDGMPNGEAVEPEAFAKFVQQGDYIAGMGIAPSKRRPADDDDGNDEEEDNDKLGREILVYTELFHSMGINNILTPRSDPAEIRHAINQFSQSVAAFATA